MQFANATPATTVNTLTSPDGKWTITVTTTTSTTTTLQYASIDGTTALNGSGSIFDSLNTWTVNKGVIYQNGVALAGTNNVARLVWKSGVIYQTNGTLWWSWDNINEIWATATAPV